MKVPYSLDYAKRQILISTIFLVFRIGFLLIIQKEKTVSINWDILCIGVVLILDVLYFLENKKRIKKDRKTIPQYRVIYKKHVYLLYVIIGIASLGIFLMFSKNVATISTLLYFFINLMIGLIYDWKKSIELYH